MKSLLAFLILLCLIHRAAGQRDSLHFSFSGYADTYAGIETRKPESRYGSYFYSHSFDRIPFVNLAFAEFKLTHNRFRLRAVPACGSYMTRNYSAEPRTLRNLMEAGGSFRFYKDLWIEAGILSSPFGFENALSRDQLNYTRSFSAEHSPYYLCGIRAGGKISSKNTVNLYLIQGWQNIRDNNSGKSFAVQWQHQAGDKLLFNLSGFAGRETADRRMRVFADAYAVADVHPSLRIVLLADAGWQDNGMKVSIWQTSNLTARWKWNPRWYTGGRLEYFLDPGQVIITHATSGKSNFFSASLNADRNWDDVFLARVEARWILGTEDAFHYASGKAGRGTLLFRVSLTAVI